jgi:Ca-activated chloride channel family protein
MRFADPIWLVVGAASVTVLVVLLVRAERLKARALALLGGTRARAGAANVAVPSRLRRWARVAVITMAVAMGFVALARPRKGLRWETMERKGTDVLLVVDTSRSMDADDVKPTRLERVKLAIHDLVDRFPGDRIGVVAFAGDAFVQSPMTLDHGALLETVDALDTSAVAYGGTNVGRAIDVAAAALGSEPDHQKEMLLLSDGEDLEGQGLTEAKRAGEAGITIDTVGVGSREGEIVPAKDDQGRVVGVVRDESGAPVRSRVDEKGLQEIAAAGHGTYRPLGADGQGLDRLYTESLAPRARVETSSRTRRVYTEWFPIPLGLALLGIVLDSLLALRWRRDRWRAVAHRGTPALAAAGAAAMLLLAPTRAHASPAHAAKAYAAGHFEDAAKEYEADSAKEPKDARLAFNAGDAAYRAGHYEAAKAAFDRALAAADPTMKEHVFYNEGDAFYRLGESHQADARAKTIEQWKAAITAYDGALALDPKDADARFNRDLVKRKLAALEQKEKEEQQQKEKEKQSQKQEPKDQKQDAKDPGKDGKNGKDGKDGKPQPSGPKPNGQPSASPGAQNGAPPPPAGGRAGGEPSAARPGELSPRDARALLGALRGEERSPRLGHGVDAGTSPDQAPTKDW